MVKVVTAYPCRNLKKEIRRKEGVRVEYGVTGETLGIEVTGVSRFLAKTLIRKIEEGIPKFNTGFVIKKRGKYKRDIL